MEPDDPTPSDEPTIVVPRAWAFTVLLFGLLLFPQALTAALGQGSLGHLLGLVFACAVFYFAWSLWRAAAAHTPLSPAGFFSTGEARMGPVHIGLWLTVTALVGIMIAGYVEELSDRVEEEGSQDAGDAQG